MLSISFDPEEIRGSRTSMIKKQHDYGTKKIPFDPKLLGPSSKVGHQKKSFSQDVTQC